MVLLEMSHVYLHYYQFDRAKVKWKGDTHSRQVDVCSIHISNLYRSAMERLRQWQEWKWT